MNARLRSVLRRARPWLVPVATMLVVLAVLVVVTDAWARPGGGQSFSGSRSSGSSGGSRSSGGSFGSSGSSRSSSGSSSSSGGGGDASGFFNLIIWLVFEVPALGIPLFIAFVAYMVYSKMKPRSDWSTSGPVQLDTSRSPRSVLQDLRNEDPNFSIVLFEDFLVNLYAQAHEARGRGAIDELGPYLTDPVRAMLRPQNGLRQVKGIVVGAMRIISAQIGGAQASVTVEFEANMTEVSPSGEQAFYVVETWTLVRRRGAQSKPPQQAKTLGCPNCGAPRTALRGSRCAQCGNAVGDGAFDWTVTTLNLAQREARPPLLTGTVEEQGTNLPTIIDRNVAQSFQALVAKDPQVTWPSLQQRIGLAFRELQVAWSAQELARARAFLSDGQFQSMLYWIETYRRSHLRNVTENAQITNMELVRVTQDRFYDAVTVRIYATGLDYTIDQSGKVVAGNRSKARPYSEYWTLVRGSERRGPTRTEPVCPNCGAPLNVNMAGTCGYCNVVITTGDFDWVVSRIEQDEAYLG